ncbi:MAG: hypothetical protein AABZ00_06075 [Chloroflexota bacterium]
MGFYHGEACIKLFIIGGETTLFPSTSSGHRVGAHYEVTNGTAAKYYFAGSQRIAMKTGSTLTYLLSDHVSTSSTTTPARRI